MGLRVTKVGLRGKTLRGCSGSGCIFNSFSTGCSGVEGGRAQGGQGSPEEVKARQPGAGAGGRQALSGGRGPAGPLGQKGGWRGQSLGRGEGWQGSCK